VKFREALDLMKHGEKLKMPEWSGYWTWEKNVNSIKVESLAIPVFVGWISIEKYLEGGTIIMHCKEGVLMDIRETKDLLYTLEFIMRDDWEVADETNSKLLRGEVVVTFGIGEAIRKLKQGKLVTRLGWNGKNQFLYFMRADEFGSKFKYRYKDQDEPSFLDQIVLKTTNNKLIVGWTPTSKDLLALDYIELDYKEDK
jgi:hypothetical protein